MIVKKLFLAITAITIYLGMVGCSTTHHAISDPEFAATRPMNVQPLPVNDGAIYKTGFGVALYEDSKARRIGDIITIILRERTNASKSASTTTERESEVTLAPPILFGKPMTHNGRDILSATVDSESDFTGEGDSTQSNSLTGQISVTVVDVYPNGNLFIRGEKLLTLNQGSEHVRISGIVRPTDVSPTNTVYSTQVANARIIYGGQGVLAEVNSKGWIQRLFDSNWWPL